MGYIANELRHRVQIQHFVEQRDGFNNVTSKEWETYKTLWGKISSFSGKDLIAAQAAGSQMTARLKLRKRSDITTEMRVLHGEVIYQIVSPPQPDDINGNIYMTVMLSVTE
ncbi:head-tail adaptor protein [Acinetobacter chinensis]|uniref:Head-tail adaptor protein n=1 Tax=Acinetobacter chinensis TaxID=2004650 RepID=A0A3B7LWW6_9GAMM|nr:phage head closure protein [Acinetobacter chinensis]AXY57272.1 head-tail adaptor protein [Acinetobacter chinensis]